MRKIIFVCHGNICRSVAAQFIAEKLVKEQHKETNFIFISRATSSEEIGNDIYPPMKRALDRANIEYSLHSAQQITQDDYEWADEIYYMDSLNRRYLNNLIDDHRHIIYPISKKSPSIGDIDDPWYSGEYDIVIQQIEECLKTII